MNGVLNQVEHAKIIADMERVSMVAGVQGQFLYESMTSYCGPGEIDWVKNFHAYRSKGVPGLVLEGVSRPDTKCQAIAAALIRNYIDARVIPLNLVLNLNKNGGMPSPTVLLVPNLFVSSIAKGVPVWNVQAIYDLLLQRAVQNKPTVVYVEDLTAFKQNYGVPFGDFISNFKIVK